MNISESLAQQIKAQNPLELISEKETNIIMLKFCSYVSMLHNKRLSSVGIFSLILENPSIRNIYRQLCEVETDREALALFVEFHPNVCKSKVINSKSIINEPVRKESI